MTSGRHQFSWNPTQDKTLTKLWSDGLSATEISAHMGKTRNAILGRARRIDLPMRRPAMTGPNAGTRQRSRVPTGRTARRPKAAPQFKPKHMRPPTEPELTEAQRAAAWFQIPGSSPVGLLDLSDAVCRWPIGESPFKFCGLPTTQGSYCAHHADMSTGRGSGFERAAIKLAIDANKAEWAASAAAERKRWEKAA